MVTVWPLSRFLLTAFLAVGLLDAGAAPKKSVTRAAKKPVAAVQAAPAQSAHRRSPYVGAIAVNAQTGTVIFEENADAEAYPASVTKLMTLLLVLEDVKAGRYGLDDLVTATADVYRSEPSWIGIKVGEKMSVRSLCTALMVESANDAAIMLGVHSAGSFDAFVARMNARAAELGMAKTRYYNPNGLPPNGRKRYPWKSFNLSTARDQALLARTLVKIPEAMSMTSVKTCDLVKTSDGYRTSVTRRVNAPQAATQLADGEKVVKNLSNHNNLMRMDQVKYTDAAKVHHVLPRIVNADGKESVDGLKTGYIDAGGSSIVLTGSRGGKRAIVVVLGSATSKERDYHAHNLMNDALGSLSW